MGTALILVELADQRREHERRIVVQEADLRAALAREGRRNEEKDQFLALLAHELRNPATVIRGAAQLLERDGLDACDRDALVRDVSLEADRLCALIEDMLSVAVAEDGAAPAAEPIRLERIIPTAVAAVSSPPAPRREVGDRTRPAARCRLASAGGAGPFEPAGQRRQVRPSSFGDHTACTSSR